MFQIGIDVVLAKLNDTVDEQDSAVKTFGVRFINREGEKREIICRKHTKDATKKITGTDDRGKDYFNLQRNGVIILDDLDNGHPRTIKTAMIYGFKDYQSEGWHNVFH